MSGRTLHASCVALDGRGLLILGAAGAGKSALTLSLVALGAVLVGDDRIVVFEEAGRLCARTAPAIGGKVEARGIGILSNLPTAEAPLFAAVDLDASPSERMPQPLWWQHGAHRVPLMAGRDVPHLAPSLAVMLRHAILPDVFAPLESHAR
ncbi:MAG: serine kinase [Pseudomonadota bacterium]